MLLRELFTAPLSELFNFSYPYTMIADKKYMLSGKIKQYVADTQAGELGVNFLINPIDTISISFTVDGNFDITGLGQGEQFRIFGTVVEIIKNHLPNLIDNRTKKITFSADRDEVSRVSLYKKLAPKLTQILGNEWEFKEKLHGIDYAFIWTRTESSDEILLELGNSFYLMTEIAPGNFVADTTLGKLDLLFEKNYNEIHISFKIDENYNITKKAKHGEQFKILNTVWKTITEELPTFITSDIDQIIFTSDASETSRVSLYDKIAPKLTNILGNEWKYTPKKYEDIDEVYYIWVRKPIN